MSWPPPFTAVALRELNPRIEPIAVVEGLRGAAYPWLLDSSGAPGEPAARLARYSFAGADPYLVLRAFGGRSTLEWREEPGRASNASVRERPRSIDGDPLDVMRALQPAFPGSIRRVGESGERGSDRAPAEIAALSPFLGGAVGLFGYELSREDQPVRERAAGDLALPDLVLLFVDRLVVVDHQDERAFAVGLGFGSDLPSAEARAEEVALALADRLADRGRPAGGPRANPSIDALAPIPREELLAIRLPDDAVASFDEAGYLAAVERIREEIAWGNFYQANLTQRVDLPVDGVAPQETGDFAWQIYRALRRLSPAPFAAYLELPEVAVVSSSPERFLSLDRAGRVESRPIKGTRPRGATPDRDQLLAKELAESTKDRAENLMIVDLVRNDLGRVCEPGSVAVPELMSIERYATVHQMVSSVTGRLRADRDHTDLIRATFPPGSMTGAPKLAAMRIIDDLEGVRRGLYSGALGYIDAFGGLDLSVVIRTLLVRRGVVHLHGGGAVVHDSRPADEYREALDKIRALLAAVAFLRGAHEPVSLLPGPGEPTLRST